MGGHYFSLLLELSQEGYYIRLDNDESGWRTLLVSKDNLTTSSYAAETPEGAVRAAYLSANKDFNP